MRRVIFFLFLLSFLWPLEAKENPEDLRIKEEILSYLSGKEIAAGKRLAGYVIHYLDNGKSVYERCLNVVAPDGSIYYQYRLELFGLPLSRTYRVGEDYILRSERELPYYYHSIKPFEKVKIKNIKVKGNGIQVEVKTSDGRSSLVFFPMEEGFRFNFNVENFVRNKFLKAFFVKGLPEEKEKTEGKTLFQIRVQDLRRAILGKRAHKVWARYSEYIVNSEGNLKTTDEAVYIGGSIEGDDVRVHDVGEYRGVIYIRVVGEEGKTWTFYFPVSSLWRANFDLNDFVYGRLWKVLAFKDDIYLRLTPVGGRLEEKIPDESFRKIKKEMEGAAVIVRRHPFFNKLYKKEILKSNGERQALDISYWISNGEMILYKVDWDNYYLNLHFAAKDGRIFVIKFEIRPVWREIGVSSEMLRKFLKQRWALEIFLPRELKKMEEEERKKLNQAKQKRRASKRKILASPAKVTKSSSPPSKKGMADILKWAQDRLLNRILIVKGKLGSGNYLSPSGELKIAEKRFILLDNEWVKVKRISKAGDYLMIRFSCPYGKGWVKAHITPEISLEKFQENISKIFLY